MDRKHDEIVAGEKQPTAPRRTRTKKRPSAQPQRSNTSVHANSELRHDKSDPYVNDFVILHRIGEIFINLLNKTLAKSTKHPKEAEIVNEILRSFINRKLREIYGFSDSPTKSELEKPLTKNEAQEIISGMLSKIRAPKNPPQQQSQKPQATTVSPGYVNPPAQSVPDDYNPHSFRNNRDINYDEPTRGGFSQRDLDTLANRLTNRN